MAAATTEQLLEDFRSTVGRVARDADIVGRADSDDKARAAQLAATLRYKGMKPRELELVWREAWDAGRKLVRS